MRETLAKLTSNLVNPFLVSFIVLILLAFKGTQTTTEALRWASIAIVLSVLPVFIVVIYLAHQGKLDGIFINPRGQRTKIYIFASVLAIIGFLVLYNSDAPELLVAAFCAGMAAIFIFMIINIFWKISLHTGFLSASITVVTIVYGALGALTILLFLPVAWSRIKLKLHTPAQVASGALLSAAIVIIVYWLFGLTGW